MSIEKMNNFLESGDYLPFFLKDFHDQKVFFKSMHLLYQDNPSADIVPNWRDGQIYTIDWFLWFCASRGYTLQKNRTKGVGFKDLPDFRDLQSREG